MAKQRFSFLSREDERKLPGPLYELLQLRRNDAQPFRKVHRLIDAIEWAIKWHTVLAVADLVREKHFTDRLKVLFAEGLRSPSLGTWVLFWRESVKGLQQAAIPHADWSRLDPLDKAHQLVALRNKYAHGATPDDAACTSDCEKALPVLLQLIGSELFTQVRLVGSGSDGAYLLQGAEASPVNVEFPPGHAAAILPDDHVLDLWPLGQYVLAPEKGQAERFFYYNALKSHKVVRLNYELALQQRDKALWDEFHAVFPLSEWRRADAADLRRFREHILLLTETFEGRADERMLIREFCATGQGALLLLGSPGIGKSALLARVVQETRAAGEGGEEVRSHPPVVEYFIRNTLGTDSPDTFLKHLCLRLDALHELTGIPLGVTRHELQDNLLARLDALDTRARDTHDVRETVLCVDGLDECTDILRYIPESRNCLKVILATRPVTTVTDWWKGWSVGRTRKAEHTVRPLGKFKTEQAELDEIHAILLRVVDKYQIGFNEEFVEAIRARSQGNPLYLKLLCDLIFEDAGKVPDLTAIPDDLQKLYDVTVKGLSDGARDADVLAVLYLLAEARCPLTVETIAEFLDLDTLRAHAAVDKIRELLFEEPSTPEIEDFQLFHESLREWLRERSSRECARMAQRLTDLCFDWRNRQDPAARDYALEFAAEHLYAQKSHECLWTLLMDDTYLTAQQTHLRQYAPSLQALKRGLELYVERDGTTPEDDGRLCAWALRAGEIGHKARTDIHVAFEWAETRPLDDPRRMDDALKRLDVLDEKNFFKASLLLLWIEADRRRVESENQRCTDDAEKVLDAADKRIPEGAGTAKDFGRFLEAYAEKRVPERVGMVDWSRLVDVRFMAFWIRTILTAFPLDRDNRFVRFLGHTEPWNAEFALALVADTKTEAMTAALRHRLHRQAIVAAGRIHSLTYKAEALCMVAASLANAGNREGADDAFTQALAAAKEIAGPKDKAAALSSINTAMASAGDRAGAHDVFSRALRRAEGSRSRGRTSIYDLSKITGAIARAGDIPDLELEEIATAAADVGLFGQALAAAKEIDDVDYRDKILSYVIATMTRIDVIKSRNAFGQVMIAAGEIDSTCTRNYALSAIASSLTQDTKFDQALLAAERVDTSDHKAKALCNVAAAMANAGDHVGAAGVFAKALAVAGEIDENGDKAETLRNIAAAMAVGGDHDGAAEAFAKALAVAKPLGNTLRRWETCSTIAAAMARAGNLDGARSALPSAVTVVSLSGLNYTGMRPAMAIVKAMTEAQRLDLAQDTLRQLLVLVDLHFKSGWEKRARRENCYERLRLLRSETLRYIAEGIAQSTQFAQASAIASSIDDDACRGRALSGIAAEMMKRGDVPERDNLFIKILAEAEAIESAYPKAKALAGIASAMTEAGYTERAQDIFARALAEAEGIDDARMRGSTLCSMAAAMVKGAYSKDARSASLLSLAAAEEVNDGPWMAENLPVVAATLCKTDEAQRLDSFLARASLPADAWKKILGEWRNTLIAHGPPSLALLRKSLLHFPSDPENAYDGVYALNRAFYATKDFARAETVIRHCPQLKLGFLLPPTIERTCGNVHEWIERVEDEDDREQIALWTRRVRKGQMTEEDFFERVRELLGDETR